jgi:hypothetical protein
MNGFFLTTAEYAEKRLNDDRSNPLCALCVSAVNFIYSVQ